MSLEAGMFLKSRRECNWLKLEECKKCKYHNGAMFDNIICRRSGSTDYRVVAKDKKGIFMVLECPMETVRVTRRAAEWYSSFKQANTPSVMESIK